MYMSLGRFDHNCVEYGVIQRPDHSDFDAVYRCYQRCFPLPTEQESKENFLAVLGDNGDGKPGCEIWVYIKDKTTGDVMGADNFAVFPTTHGHDINGTCQDIYVFVQEKYRQQGVYSTLVSLREKAAARYLMEIGRIHAVTDARICTFAEQNNALMMTPAQYCEDSEAAIDQCLRRSIFERFIRTGDVDDDRVPGFRTLQMRYVQPPLEPNGEVCDYLDFVAKTPDRRTGIAAAVVREHLDRFFEKSFPEGTCLDGKGLEGMKRDLESQKEIPFEPEGKFNKLGQHLSVAMLSQLPAEDYAIRIGELRPDLVQGHYGDGVLLRDVMDSYTRIRDKIENAKSPPWPACTG